MIEELVGDSYLVTPGGREGEGGRGREGRRGREDSRRGKRGRVRTKRVSEVVVVRGGVVPHTPELSCNEVENWISSSGDSSL